jgi:hypothetical protein
MKRQTAKGLLAFWTDIDHENLLEVQKWHNCEHMTERVSIPGFLVGRRYRGIGNAPTFFISYETTEADVLKSEPYLRALNNATPWTKQALTYFKNNIRNICGLVSSEGKPALTEAPFIYVIRFNFESGAENEGVEGIKNKYLPEICALSGVYRSRLYQIDEEISSIMTGEREIYGGGPGQQKYLLIFELAAPDLPKEEGWQNINGDNRDMLQKCRDKYEEFSFLEFVMYAPEGS